MKKKKVKKSLHIEDVNDNYAELKAKNKALKKELKALEKKQCKGYQKWKEAKELKPYQAELIKLQKHLEHSNQKMIILFEGRDAAGKGGTIRRVSRYMNEKHYRIVALGKPTDQQKSQWFYQKYIEQFPTGGEIVLFDRSWYNRAMVEHVFGFCSQKEYENFMRGVKGLEKDIVRQGTILIKLYFSVTKDEQARRFERRKTDPLRQWKLSEIDIQAQDRWDDFTKSKYEMLRQSNSHQAPWIVLRSDDKHAARLEALKVILNSVDYEDRDETMNFIPNHNIVVSGSRELEIMEDHRVKLGKFLH